MGIPLLPYPEESESEMGEDNMGENIEENMNGADDHKNPMGATSEPPNSVWNYRQSKKVDGEKNAPKE